MAGVLKQIEIVEDDDLKTVEEKVNDVLAGLCDECINTDKIEILCNITTFDHRVTYYTYTIIYEKE